MATKAVCPKCANVFRFEEKGQRYRCANCGKKLTVPGGEPRKKKKRRKKRSKPKRTETALLPVAEPVSNIVKLPHQSKRESEKPFKKQDSRPIHEKQIFLLPVLFLLAAAIGVTASLIYSANYAKVASSETDLESEMELDQSATGEANELANREVDLTNGDSSLLPNTEFKPQTEEKTNVGADKKQASGPDANVADQNWNKGHAIDMGGDKTAQAENQDRKSEVIDALPSDIGLTLDIKQKIYASLLPSRKRAMEVAAKRAKGGAGVQAEYRKLSRAFFQERLAIQLKYGITASQLEEIISQGDANGWADIE